MARVPYFDMTKAPESYQALMKARQPLNLYRMLPWAGKAGEGFLALGGALLRENRISSQLREVAILRVGILSKASYEVHQHKRVARNVGMSDATIAALEVGADTSVLTDDERAVLEFTDQLLHHVKAPDAMFNAMLERFGPEGVSELVLTIGFYMMVCRYLETFDVEIEATPPEGKIDVGTPRT